MSGSTNSTVANADSVVRKAFGVITPGTTATSVTIALGFVPKKVKVQGIVNLLSQEWQVGMNQGDFFETAANGTRTLETDDKLIVGAATDGPDAAVPAGSIQIVTGGGILDDNDGAIWEAEG